jgi:hypothetical protein
MGYDLQGRGGASFNIAAWSMCLDVATAFGWKPAGTIGPDDCDGEWGGGYFSNDYQQVTDDDARALAAALRQALVALETKQTLTKEQSKACDAIHLGVIRKLANYAEGGRFAIG